MRKIKVNPDAVFLWYHKVFLVVLMVLLLLLVACVVHGSAYQPDVYCCRHMSRDIECFWERYGLDVQLVTGADSVFNRHMWVRICGVDFDSVYFVPLFPALIYCDGVEVYDSYKSYCEVRGYVE